MRLRTTIMLGVVAIISVALAWRLYERGPTASASGTRLLLAADALPIEGVRRIRIAKPPLAPMIIERRGSAWIETQPFEIPVNPFEIRETILAARQLRSTRRIELNELLGESSGERTSGGLEALSLRPPLASITFTMDDGRETTIRLGRLGVAGRAFVQVGDDQAVFVVGQELHERLLGDGLRSWRERTLFPEASIEVAEIEVRTGETRTTLSRRGRAWRLESPVETRADASAVMALLQSLARAEADGFVAEAPEDLRSFGLHAPPASISLRWRVPGEPEPRSRTLLIGGAVVTGGADRYAMIDGRPLVMRVSGSTLGSIFVAPPSVIEPTAAAGRPEDVREIRIVGPRDEVHLRRTPRGLFDEAGAASQRRADELLDTLFTTRASAISMQAYPETIHVATATLIGFDDAPMAVVRIAIDPNAGQWATEAGDGVLRIHPISALPALIADQLAP